MAPLIRGSVLSKRGSSATKLTNTIEISIAGVEYVHSQISRPVNRGPSLLLLTSGAPVKELFNNNKARWRNSMGVF